MSTTFSHPGLPNLIHIFDPDMPRLLRASDHRPAPVQWLWPGRIPLGSITLLAGDPGAGKSLFAIDLASRVSRGSAFPDEAAHAAGAEPSGDERQGDKERGRHADPTSSACVFASESPQSEIPNPQSLHSKPHAPGSVLILSAADQFHDTILPRLAAAGADQSRVYVLEDITNLRTEMEKLRAAINDAPDLRLLVLDPINFYVGPGDAHFQTVVRSVLQPLAELAHRKNFAILAITHFRKNDGRALERAAGSMGFVSTARTIWTITQDPEDESRRYLVPLKNNLTAPMPSLAFHITARGMTNDECPMTNEQGVDANFVIRHSEVRHSPSAPHLAWDSTPLSATELPTATRPRPSTPREEAQNFLRETLANGPRPASELLDQADCRGLPRRTVQRAFHDLEGCTTKRGFRAGWWWSLGEYPIGPIPDFPEIHPLAEPTYATDVASNIAALRRTELLNELANIPPTQPPRPQPTTNTRPSKQTPTHTAHAQHTQPATPTPCSKPPAPCSPLSPPPTLSPSPSVSPSPKPRQKTPHQPRRPLSPSPAVSPSVPPPSTDSPLRRFMRHPSRPRPEQIRSCDKAPPPTTRKSD